METSTVLTIMGVVIAALSLVSTIAMFIQSSIRTDIQSLYRIKTAISNELAQFKQEAAREFVTYNRMNQAMDQHTRSLTDAIARIEQDLKALPKLQILIAGMAAKMNINPTQQEQ